MSNTVFIVALSIVVVLNALVVWFLVKKNKKEDEKPQDNTGLSLLLQQVNELSRVVDSKMGEVSRNMFDTIKHQTGESFKIHRDLTEKLVRLEETNKQVVSFSDQLRSLQDILKNPKQRGVLGEYYLETLLKNVLPPGSYQMQYPFPDGTIVDAAVFVKDKIIPVDSKFSLENYNRIVEETNAIEKEKYEKAFVNDLKLRIQETSKYIQPEQGTMDFAFMFIPHEAIYYDLIVNKIGALKEETESLVQRAASKYKVIIVSPTSFLAYLQTVLQGLKAMQIEESAKEIRSNVELLGKHLQAYSEYQSKLGNALGTVVNHFNNSTKEFKKIDKDIFRISGLKSDVLLDSVEKPAIEEE